jgi:phosphoribosylglycinamide formyltransferase-1
MNVGVLVSGQGTNLQALLDAEARGELAPARIAIVISNKPDAPALSRATAAGVPTRVIDHRGLARRVRDR